MADRPNNTSDFFAPNITTEAIYSPAFRIMMVDGDNMEPGLRNRFDYVLVAPVEQYEGEGLYVIQEGNWTAIKRCQVDGQGSIWLLNDNKIYFEQSVPREWFDEHVIGKVVADIKVRDHCKLEGRPRPKMESVRFV